MFESLGSISRFRTILPSVFFTHVEPRSVDRKRSFPLLVIRTLLLDLATTIFDGAVQTEPSVVVVGTGSHESPLSVVRQMRRLLSVYSVAGLFVSITSRVKNGPDSPGGN